MADRYTIQTGDYQESEVGTTMEEAVIRAFKRNAPVEPSLLTRAKKHHRGKWFYIATDLMLKKAGYKVRL